MFLLRNLQVASLITVTSASLSKDGKRATVFFTVFPDSGEPEALKRAKALRSDFQEHMRKNSGLGRVPFLDFAIDGGEKNRQKIDSISNL